MARPRPGSNPPPGSRDGRNAARRTSLKKGKARARNAASGTTARRWTRRVAAGLLAALVLAFLGFGWMWQRALPLRAVEVVGTVEADPAEVARLAAVTPVDSALADSAAVATPLFGLDPALIADRVQRHPWVREAHVTRLPTGTLKIRVEEREPVALALTEAGTPAYYLDREGFRMPVAALRPGGPVYDVPLVRGAGPYAPQRHDDASVRALAAALAELDPDVDALVAEIAWGRTGATLVTAPATGRDPLRVRLGRSAYARRLRAFRAFWEQAVLPRPHVQYELVDLRFEGQVVTRET